MLHSLVVPVTAALGLLSPVAPSTGETRIEPLVPIASSQDEETKEEDPRWSGGIDFGGTLTRGNSETLTVNLLADAERRTEDDRTTLRGFWNFGQTDDEGDTVKTVADFGGRAKYDYFVTEDLFYLANASFKVDSVAELDLRYVLGAGVGYQVEDTETLEWGIEAGLSFVSEDFQTAGDDEEYVSARLGSTLAWQATATTSFQQVVEILPGLENGDEIVMSWDNRLQMKINDSWSTMLQYVFDYDNTPATGQERDDHKIVFTLGWSFGS